MSHWNAGIPDEVAGEGVVVEHGGLDLRSLSRPSVGAWSALAVFGLLCWWSLMDDEAVGGFVWFCAAAGAGIQVSRWLARFGAQRLASWPRPGRGWFDSGSAMAVGFVLLFPGTACWLAARVLLSERGHRTPRGSRAVRLTRAALWALWALAGTTGQLLLMAWLPLNGSTSTSTAPEIVLAGAGLLNAISMSLLIWLEPESGRYANG